MPKARSAVLFLTDIINAIESIKKHTTGMDFEDFSQDEKTKDAVIFRLEVIGEATKNLPKELKDRCPKVQWKLAMGMRDRLVHGYFGVEDTVVWETITHDLPPFEKEIRKILEQLQKDNGN